MHWISLQDEIQADFVDAVFWYRRHYPHRLPDQRWDGECWALLRNTAEIKKGDSEQTEPMLSCSTITLGHTRIDSQQISCRSSAWRCLIFHLIVRFSRPVISIFSYTSRNSFLVSVSVFRMTEWRRWEPHSGSKARRQTSMTQGYKSWSHGMTNVSIPEVNVLKNAQHLLFLFQ